MKQARPIQAKHAPLLGLFLNGYENMRQKMDEPCRRPLLDIGRGIELQRTSAAFHDGEGGASGNHGADLVAANACEADGV